MSRPSVLRRGALAAAVLLPLAVGGCNQLDRIMEISFPPEVPGLSDGQPWVSLPIGGWVTESSIEGGLSADAIAACFAPECGDRASVGVFRAEGDQAAALIETAQHPDLLKARLEAESRQPMGRRKPQPVMASIRPLTAGALQGFSLHLARPDGSHAVYGALLVSQPAAGRITALIIFAANGASVERVAQNVAPRLS